MSEYLHLCQVGEVVDDRTFIDRCNDTAELAMTSHSPEQPAAMTYAVWLDDGTYAKIDASAARANFSRTTTTIGGIRSTTAPIPSLNGSGRFALLGWHPWTNNNDMSTAGGNSVTFWFRTEDNADNPLQDGLGVEFYRNGATDCYVKLHKYDSVNGDETGGPWLLEDLEMGVDDGYDLYFDIDNDAKSITVYYAVIGSSTLTLLNSKVFTYDLPSSTDFRYIRCQYDGSGASQWGAISIDEMWFLPDGGSLPTQAAELWYLSKATFGRMTDTSYAKAPEAGLGSDARLKRRSPPFAPSGPGGKSNMRRIYVIMGHQYGGATVRVTPIVDFKKRLASKTFSLDPPTAFEYVRTELPVKCAKAGTWIQAEVEVITRDGRVDLLGIHVAHRPITQAASEPGAG